MSRGGQCGRYAFCKQQYPNGFPMTVPVNQGIFVHDTKTGKTEVVAKAPGQFSDFVYWNFSGLVPGTGESDEDDDRRAGALALRELRGGVRAGR